MKNLKQSYLSVSLVLVVSLFLVSCASSEMILPTDEMTPYPAAGERTQFLSKQTFQFANVVDSRNAPAHDVGWTESGLRERTPVRFENTVAQTLTQQITSELKKRGFNFSNPANIQISMTIQKLTLEKVVNDAFWAPSCDTELKFQLSQKQSGHQTEIAVKSRFTAPAPVLNNQEANAETVASCLNMAVERLVKNDDFQNFVANSAQH